MKIMIVQKHFVIVLALAVQPLAASKPAPQSGSLQSPETRLLSALKNSAPVKEASTSVATKVESKAKKDESKTAQVKKDDKTAQVKKETSVQPKSPPAVKKEDAASQKSSATHFMVNQHRAEPANIKTKNVGESVSTCGGSEDMEGEIQMEQTNNKPCKFPFTYRGKTYNGCVAEEKTDRHWCFTEFPPEGEKGPVRWAICNLKKEQCPETAVHSGKMEAKANDMEKIAYATNRMKVWFEFWYWQPLLACALVIMFFAEIAWPLADKLFGTKQIFVVHSALFMLTMLCFFLCAAMMADPKAAAASHIMGISTLMVVLGVLLFFAACVLACRRRSWTHYVAEDFAVVLLPLTRGILSFIVLYGIMENVDTSYSGIVTISAFLMLGVSMAMSGVIGDLIAYIFIRANGWFQEGDFIHHGGELIQVVDIEWRHTKAFSFSKKCTLYIPNGLLGNKELANQSQDAGRVLFTTIPLSPSLSGAQLENIVKDVWTLLRSQDKPFTALNGNEYPTQLDVKNCNCCISDHNASESAKELSQITLTVKLAALYYYSKAPPGKDGQEPEGDWRDHQWDWIAGWNFQKEQILIQIQKILEKHSK